MFYYTADLHFGHGDTLKHAKRPFASVEEMDRAIITNINSRCGKDDVLVVLGDVSFYGNYEGAIRCLKSIRCRKVLVTGNHDKGLLKSKRFRECFADITQQETIRDGAHRIFLSHYPMAEWDGYYKGIWHFYGHVHNSTGGAAALMDLVPTAVNAGVDVNGFMPKTADRSFTVRSASRCAVKNLRF